MEISKSGLQSGSMIDLLKLSWAINQQKLKDAFDRVEITIDCEKDLQTLADIHAKKIDVEGGIKDENNNPIMFDTKMVLNTIEFSPEEKEGKTISKEVIFIQ